MFVAFRDIKFAKGRFLLIGTVVALITLLVGSLTGLAAGLGNQNISSIIDIKASSIVLSGDVDGEKATWDTSAISQKTMETWKQNPNVDSVYPLGIQRAKVSGSKDSSVVLFGLQATTDVAGDSPSGNGIVRVSENAAKDLAVKSGDKVKIGKKEYIIEQVSEESWYSHSAIIRMSIDDFKEYTESVGQTDVFANVLLVNAKGDVSTVAQDTNTVVYSKWSSLTALSTFKSEIGSLGMMIAMLFGISALVIGAFFTVWTIQRKPDIAVLKALGVSTKAILWDSLAQAFIVLIVGIAIGTLGTIAIGLVAGSVLPFILSPLTILAPAILMLVMGLIGAASALRSVVTVDPLTALNASH